MIGNSGEYQRTGLRPLRARIATCAVLLLLTVFPQPDSSKAFAADESQRPNIVLILADDLGWSDTGCYGHVWHRTPHIDGLAKQGLRFTNGYSPAPICSAARASILTGKTTARLGFEFVTKNAAGHQKLDAPVPLQTPAITLNLPLSETTLGEMLGALNYETAFFGKWHVSTHYQKRYLAWHPEFGPRKQGFQTAVEDFGDHPYAWKKVRPPAAANGVIPRDSMIERAADFIAQPHQRPFFLMLSAFHVHTPVQNRCRWLVDEYDAILPRDLPQRKKRLEYAAFVQTLDHHVGRILKAIDDAGLRSSTLVVFTSDNGGHPEYSANGPLRGSKWNLYEGGVRVPWIMRWPGRIPAATTCATPVIGYDLLPTFRDVAGGGKTGIDGVSIVPAFRNPDWQPSRSLIWHFPYYHPETTFSKAVRTIGVNDFVVSQTRPQSALRIGKHKLLWFAEDDRVELYNLQQDPSEQHDLSGQQSKLAAELKSQLQQQLNDMQARRAIPRRTP